MHIEGGCYCGSVRYSLDGEPIFRAQCHCRECQYMTGGAPNMVMGLPDADFRYTQGETRSFTRPDLDNAVTREFCPDCGTPLLTRSPAMPGAIILKAGTMDDPSLYEGPQMAIFCCDKQSFHTIPEGVPSFDKAPG